MNINTSILDLILSSPFCNKNLTIEPLEKFKQNKTYKHFVSKLDDEKLKSFNELYYELGCFNEDITMENLKILLYMGIKLGIEVEHLIVSLEKL